MTSSYRSKFARREDADSYESFQYASSSYSSILWEIEKSQLASVVQTMRTSHGSISYLDFATGTGRVLSFMEQFVDRAVGIEVSPTMLAHAQDKVQSAKLLNLDITADDAEVEDKYDLITAFRFFLNAESDLRVKAMRSLAARLRDEKSLLVFNNHGNLLSHKLLMWPVHQIKARVANCEGNYMTYAAIRQCASAAGLSVRLLGGCGLLSNKIARLVGRERAIQYEKTIAACPAVWPFCVNQMYVAHLRG